MKFRLGLITGAYLALIAYMVARPHILAWFAP